jgi:hypothetical protein
MFTIEMKKVGTKRDSVGCWREEKKALGNRMKRVVRRAQKVTKRTRSRMNTGREKLATACQSAQA